MLPRADRPWSRRGALQLLQVQMAETMKTGGCIYGHTNEGMGRHEPPTFLLATSALVHVARLSFACSARVRIYVHLKTRIRIRSVYLFTEVPAEK